MYMRPCIIGRIMGLAARAYVRLSVCRVRAVTVSRKEKGIKKATVCVNEAYPGYQFFTLKCQRFRFPNVKNLKKINYKSQTYLAYARLAQ